MICAVDIEVGPDYLIVGIMDLDTGEVWQLDETQKPRFRRFTRKVDEWVSFNGIAYDSPVIGSWLAGRDPYATSKALIEGERARWWDFPSGIPFERHIDLMNVAPGQGGLKLYGARIGTKKIQEIPVDYNAKKSEIDFKALKKYNVIDLEVTRDLYRKLEKQVELRRIIGKEYGIDVLGKSDAQIAEAILSSELGVKKKDVEIYRPKEVQYKAPPGVSFESQNLRDLLDRLEGEPIRINPKSGQPIKPKWLDNPIVVGGTSYQMGIGGLHSMEKAQVVKGELMNVDVTSYYPSMIIRLGLYPQHLGPRFLEVYSNIYRRRLEAKKAGDKVVSDVLKICLNGSFGKLGSHYSILYAPDLLLTITLTGQLYLLMLIERLESKGIRVISANTDGVECQVDGKEKKLREIVSKWEKDTEMGMEYGHYRALYSRDVNNYVAVYDDHVKAKGFYAAPGMMKNPEYPVVLDAIKQFLLDGTPMEETIRACTDPLDFCVVRTVNGGALWTDRELPEYTEEKRPGTKAAEKRGWDYKKQFYDAKKDYIGKVVRYYYSKKGAPMVYAKSRNRVPKTSDYHGVKPMMKAKKKIPKDLDYSAYLDLAKRHLRELGLSAL